MANRDGRDDLRPTAPPPHEDSPPGQYRAISRPGPVPETIARIALRAPAVPTPDPQQELLKAIAATEGRMLSEISDRREEEDQRQAERQRVFEEKMQQQLQQLVVREVRSLPPPPPPSPPTKKGFEWSHLQYVAGLVVALTGLVALILNSQKPSPEILKRFDAIDQKLESANTRIAASEEARKADKVQSYEYNLSVRSWITDVLERASGVKIDDPPGTPPREALGFYPAPKIDPHKVTSAHPVQPRDPYPVPPPP